jgi:hypothetical protein
VLSRLTHILFVFLLALPVSYAETSESAKSLDRFELEELVLDKTANCRKEKDKSLCVNYFSPEGVLVQVRDSGERKDGRWFLDDSDRLCILWNGKLKPLCFVVTVNDDGSYNMVRRGKHKSTILELKDGNTENL